MWSEHWRIAVVAAALILWAILAGVSRAQEPTTEELQQPTTEQIIERLERSKEGASRHIQFMWALPIVKCDTGGLKPVYDDGEEVVIYYGRGCAEREFREYVPEPGFGSGVAIGCLALLAAHRQRAGSPRRSGEYCRR